MDNAKGKATEHETDELTGKVVPDSQNAQVVGNVEAKGFSRLYAALQPKFCLPSRQTVTRDIMKLYAQEKSSLLAKLKESHKGEALGKAVESCLLNWGIHGIFTVSLDNASANNGLIAHLIKRTIGWNDIICKHEFLHIRCAAHILNLVVSDGLKEVSYFVDKICNAARWNSTYLMPVAAIKYKKAFETLEDDDLGYKVYFSEDDEFDDSKKGRAKRIGPPETNDFNIAEVLIEFLKIFYEATLRLSGSSYVTAHSCFSELALIKNIVNLHLKSSNVMFSGMACQMKAKFDKYWATMSGTNLILYIAVPMTTVASEACFSTGGLVLDVFKSSLSPEHVEALICLQNWIKGVMPVTANNKKASDEKDAHKEYIATIEELGIELAAKITLD